ncbi:MAG: hypothetical protein M1817_000336 [Caeruleum heppii]|nr:MAG: hypothetical protein M1817_000336 [Caeruleum heppii]
MENGDAPSPSPPIPPKASHRPYARRFLGSPPRFGHESPPPPYSPYSSVTGPNGEKLSDVRNNKFIARRGGWKRLCLIIGALILALALGVGLGVGLRKKRDAARQTEPSSTSWRAPPTGPFPAGSYSINTFLESVSTSCTSNPSTWSCRPYQILSESGQASAATFNWVIEPAPASSSSAAGSEYVISSSGNPFSVAFDKVPLELVDKGQASERYRFEVPLDKAVVPSAPISDDGSAALCWFNSTTVQAQLYTSLKKTLPAEGPTSSGSTPTSSAASEPSSSFAPWPYAARVEEIAKGGADVPECFRTFNGQATARITQGLAATDPGQSCNCIYNS